MLQVLVLFGFLLGLVLARQLSSGESWEDGSIAGSSCLSDLTESVRLPQEDLLSQCTRGYDFSSNWRSTSL
jgi:hypothetical protein